MIRSAPFAAGAYARAWGSELVRLQNAGHINIESGFGAWPLGLALLQSLTEQGGWNAQTSTRPLQATALAA
jgi:predicted alpha/beta hydrolase family esterase